MTNETKAAIAAAEGYQGTAKAIVQAWVESHLDKSDGEIPAFDVYVVWFAKTLQNWKCLISTTLPDGMYYEVTHNGDADETYLDAYRKVDNVKITGENKWSWETKGSPIGIHETHKMQSVSDVPSICSVCQICACHDPSKILTRPCAGKKV